MKWNYKKLWDIEMKKTFLFFYFSIFLFTCAQTYKNENIYTLYNKYLITLNNKDYNSSIDMLSSRNKRDLVKHSSRKNFFEYFPVISTIDNVIVKEENHLNISYANIKCLTINGYDSFNEPTSLNVEYINENGLWLLDYVQVMFLESKSGFSKQAICPTRI